MEHVCHQCGASVEDGRPFCRQCNGPQIRVAIAEAEPVSVVDRDLEEESAPALPSPSRATNFTAAFRDPYKPASYSAGAIDWPRAWRASAFAALLAAFLTILPFGAPVALVIVIGGFLSVFFYRRTMPTPHLTLGAGARVGALSGILGYVASVTFLRFGTSTFSAGGEFHHKLLAILQQHTAAGADAQMQQAMDFYKSSPGFTVMIVVGLVMALAAFLLLSGLGGLVGVALLKRKTNL